jgi:uncharacterized membrane protein
LRGLTVVLPLALTAYALWWLVSSLERIFHWLWLRVLPEDWYFSGLGILLGIGAIAMVGALASAWLGRVLFDALEGLLLRVPLVKTVYSSVRDLIAFASGKKTGMGRVVVAEVAAGVRMVGLVTKEDAQRLTALPDDAGKVAVYLPMAYNLGGYLVLLPRERLTPLDMKVEDALRLAITAGIVEENLS